MEKGNTKQKISDAVLSLFSAQLVEPASTFQIAYGVGICKASEFTKS